MAAGRGAWLLALVSVLLERGLRRRGGQRPASLAPRPGTARAAADTPPPVPWGLKGIGAPQIM